MEVWHVGTVKLIDIYCTFLLCLPSSLLISRFFLSVFLKKLLIHSVSGISAGKAHLFAYGFGTVMIPWMSSEVYGTARGRTFHTVKSDILASLAQPIKHDFMMHPNATSSLVLKSVMQILTGWPPNLQPLIHFVSGARMLNSTWSEFEVCVLPSFCLSFFLSFCV